MDASGLNDKIIEGWRAAASDLGIHVTAPVELRDAAGVTFMCEALIHDFASANGAVVVSAKTERRVRDNLRSLGGSLWVCVEPDKQRTNYLRKHYVSELEDWGWFGDAERRPPWLPTA